MTDASDGPGTSSPVVALLGAGTMGHGMARNLVRAGLETVVWDRTPARALSATELGGTAAATPAAAVADADVVITMLPNLEVVKDVAEGNGMLDAMSPGAVWAQMGTIGVDATEQLAGEVAVCRADVAFVDAPVSGTKAPAEEGKLLILASGPPGVHERLAPVFSVLGSRTLWLGEAGRGSRMKIVLNTWLAFLVEGVAETVALAGRLGIGDDELLDAIGEGPLAAGLALAKIRKIAAGDFSAEFALEWALKDVDLALAAAGTTTLPVAQAISSQWHTAVEHELGALDVSAAVLAFDGEGRVPRRDRGESPE